MWLWQRLKKKSAENDFLFKFKRQSEWGWNLCNIHWRYLFSTHPVCAEISQRSGHVRNSCATKFYMLLSSVPYFWGASSPTSLPLAFFFPMLWIWCSWCSLSENLRAQACSSVLILLPKDAEREEWWCIMQRKWSPVVTWALKRYQAENISLHHLLSLSIMNFNYSSLGLRDISCKSDSANEKLDLEFFTDLN